MIVYGFDPGKSTGYCKINIEDRHFIPLDAKIMTPDLVLSWCQKRIVEETFEEESVLVCEDYIINPRIYHYDHEGDRGVALRLIGALQLTAYTLGWHFVLQMPTCKPAGYGFLGAVYDRKKAGRHIQDATAHVMYYAVQKRIVDIASSQKVPSIDAQKRSGPRISRRVSVPVWKKPSKES